MDAGATEVTDRRVLRGIRNRDAVVEAVIDLIEDGELTPTAAMIAERAGVSLRSIHNHFTDLDDLLASVAGRMIATVAALYRPLPEGGTLDERLRAFVKQRAMLDERALGMYRAAILNMREVPKVADRVAGVNAWMRDRTAEAFAPELAGAPSWKIEAIDALTSLDGWVTLRVNQRLSVQQAKRVMLHAVPAILAG